jgi:hypothetical protein
MILAVDDEPDALTVLEKEIWAACPNLYLRQGHHLLRSK